jgi:hypothetical protein
MPSREQAARKSTVNRRDGFFPVFNELLACFHQHHGFKRISGLFFIHMTASAEAVENRPFVFNTFSAYTFILGPPFFLSLPPGKVKITLLFSMNWIFIKSIALTPIPY